MDKKMTFKELQDTLTETEVPILYGSKLIGLTEGEVAERFNIKITHSHRHIIFKENRKPYDKNRRILYGGGLHMVGKCKDVDRLMEYSFSKR